MPDNPSQPVASSLYQPNAGGQMPEVQNVQPVAGGLNPPDASGQVPGANAEEQRPSVVDGVSAVETQPDAGGQMPDEQNTEVVRNASNLENTLGMPLNDQFNDKGSLPPVGPPLGVTNENPNTPMPGVVTPEQAPTGDNNTLSTNEVPTPAETPVPASVSPEPPTSETPAPSEPLPEAPVTAETSAPDEVLPAPGMPPPPTEENPMPAPGEPGVNVPVTESNPFSAPEETGANNEQGKKTDIETLATKLDEWEKKLDEEYNGFKDTYAQVKEAIETLLEERGQSNK